MEQLCRRGSYLFGVRVFGLQIAIELSSPAYLDLVLDHLPPGWDFDSPNQAGRFYKLMIAEDGQHQMFVDGERLYFHRELAEILRWFEADLQLYVGEMCEDRVFVHAGVVSWRGRTIIVPGRSFSGKTTLISALVRAGAEYYSDEYAVFDRHGLVHPYARPLGVRTQGDGTRRRCSVEELNGVRGVKPMPASFIAATHYAPGAEWKPRRLSPGCAALVLFANAVAARRQPAFALATLGKVAAGAAAFESARGEAGETADLLLNELPESDSNFENKGRELCFQSQGRVN